MNYLNFDGNWDGSLCQFLKKYKKIGDLILMSDIINNKCTGCSVAKGEIGTIIYETNTFVLNQDPEVPLKGFLVIPVLRLDARKIWKGC